MKRLKLSMFAVASRNGKPVDDETPWQLAFLNNSLELDTYRWTKEEQRAIDQMLGVKGDDGWYNSCREDENPLVSLPTGLVIEKVNRAAEELGILEDELKPLCSTCKEKEAKYGCEACNNIVCKNCSHHRDPDFRFCSDCVNPDRK